MIRVLLSSAALAGVVVLVPLPAAAQTAPPAADPAEAPALPAGQAPASVIEAPAAAEARRSPRDRATDARYKVRQMEGVLEKAVLQAARLLNQQLQSVSPELIQLTGSARARGYRLEGYGLFFDVQVPAAMRQTMGWTARLLRQRNEALQQALESLRRLSTTLDGKARSDAELAVRQLELFILPPAVQPLPRPTLGTPGSYGTTGTSVQAAAALPAETPPVAAQPELATPPPAEAAGPAPAVNPLLLQNPDLAYELEVREALISAMIEWGGLLPLAQGEWLTVAARDNQDVVIPGEAADVVTIIMRVRAGDLAAYRAGAVTLADLRQRVEVREF